MPKLIELIRANYGSVLMANTVLTPEAAQTMVATEQADIVAFGRA